MYSDRLRFIWISISISSKIVVPIVVPKPKHVRETINSYLRIVLSDSEGEEENHYRENRNLRNTSMANAISGRPLQSKGNIIFKCTYSSKQRKNYYILEDKEGGSAR